MNFEAYKNNVPYPNRVKYRDQLVSEIDSTPLTKAEREERLSQVTKLVSAWLSEAAKPYHEEERRLQEKFWADCRFDLGYEQYLTDTGVKALEAKAWADGHAEGYTNVYYHLGELCELLTEIKGEFINGRGILPKVS